MKKLVLIIALFILGFSSFAQDTVKAKPPSQHLNEFGIDATGFLKQYLDFNNSTTYYTPTYYLTYRRHFKCGNLRVAVGGGFTDNQITPSFSTDTNLKFYNQGYFLYANIGWEFYNNLSKKWQVFYGADFRTSLIYSKGDYQYNIGGYAQGNESQTQIYAIAPLLGIRFKLTKWLSILTEASLSFNWEQDINGTFYIPLPGAIQPAPSNNNQFLVKMYSSFSQPLSVFIDFTI
jgi:hypothetical protein